MNYDPHGTSNVCDYSDAYVLVSMKLQQLLEKDIGKHQDQQIKKIKE